MEIVDTVYLVAYFKPSDPLHEDAVSIIENLGDGRVISQTSLIEFDLLMKTRGLSSDERLKAWFVLYKLIDIDTIEPVTPLDIIVATYLTTDFKLDYFDALIAAQCMVRKAKPLTTDKEIIDIVSRRDDIILELRKHGIRIY